MEPTTNTPNSRLARVLRILADVAERRPLSERAAAALWFLSDDDPRGLAQAEELATEAARLAGIDVSPLPAPYQAPEVQS